MRIELPNIEKRRSGKWSVEPFTVGPMDAAVFNVDKEPWQHIEPGNYWKLFHDDRGTIMSNVPMEVETNRPILEAARGHVLINGLGLGMVPSALLSNPQVKRITVVELDKNVIALTSPMFKQAIAERRLEIIQADCYKYKPPKDAYFDAVWHDIWDSVGDENLSGMSKLKRKYAAICDWQACWAEPECRNMRTKLVNIIKRNGISAREIRGVLQTVLGEH